MSVAGVWEHWESKESGEIIDSFSIITTSGNAFMADIHDRMPVIIDREDEEEWLNSKTSSSALVSLLHPCPSKWMQADEISTLINSPKNNRPEVLIPVGEKV